MRDLTILCVTQHEPVTRWYRQELSRLAVTLNCDYLEFDGTCAGNIEAVLDDAIGECADGYVLRIDDDERVSPKMRDWLLNYGYDGGDHWAFPRVHLWGSRDQAIRREPLWPDLQTRLSRKQFAGGRTGIHQGSPYGTGQIAPVVLEHHKFLIRSFARREAIMANYERNGANDYFRVFSLPETVGYVDNGYLVPYEGKPL